MHRCMGSRVPHAHPPGPWAWGLPRASQDGAVAAPSTPSTADRALAERAQPSGSRARTRGRGRGTCRAPAVRPCGQPPCHPGPVTWFVQGKDPSSRTFPGVLWPARPGLAQSDPPLAEERAPGKPTRLRRVLGAGVDSSTAQCVPRGLRRGLRGPSEPRQRQSAVRPGRTGGQHPLKLSAEAEAGGGADGVPRAAPRRGPRSPGGPAAWRMHRVCWDVS